MLIQWRTYQTWVDLETGEVLPKEIAQKYYTIINKKIKKNAYKQTGRIEIIYECRKSAYYQQTIF